MARLGREIFFDTSLSASGRLSCASCHDPKFHYGPPDDAPVQRGGPAADAPGARAVPGLAYVSRIPNFSIGPEEPEAERPAAASPPVPDAGAARSAKLSGDRTSAAAWVPQGGLFWDGRANTLQGQAMGPLFNPVEMANVSVASVAQRLLQAPYGERLAKLFGPGIRTSPQRAVDEALSAVARFEIEEVSFHPYSSKYDAYLAGRAALSEQERRGLAVFEDKARGNCAGCHPNRPGKDGQPPVFTDFQYEALGVPRNAKLASAAGADLGLCGPFRADLARERAYCGMFRTPTLRNSAARRAFFHNGRYRTLEEVLSFYNLRDVRPEVVYPLDERGLALKFDDLPSLLRGSVDVVDPPFNRRLGEPPPLSQEDISALVAFLKTLTDQA
jgi:cytochrome c peroxidase